MWRVVVAGKIHSSGLLVFDGMSDFDVESIWTFVVNGEDIELTPDGNGGSG